MKFHLMNQLVCHREWRVKWSPKSRVRDKVGDLITRGKFKNLCEEVNILKSISRDPQTVANMVLFEAVWKLSTKAAEIALEHGANIDARDHLTLATPLIESSIIGNPQMAEFLLYNKADREAVDGIGYTAELHARTLGHIETLKVLRRTAL